MVLNRATDFLLFRHLDKKATRCRCDNEWLNMCAPGMGDNLVVKVHYGLGSRNR